MVVGSWSGARPRSGSFVPKFRMVHETVFGRQRAEGDIRAFHLRIFVCPLYCHQLWLSGFAEASRPYLNRGDLVNDSL